MEEYRDLRPDARRLQTRARANPSSSSSDAGIVLQAYLPESHAALEELIDVFASAVSCDGGGTIKVRLVKGANLAMEHVEAELHGWLAAPYGTKADVDASYLRLLDVALRPEHATSLRVGVASHNLFHVSWALELAKCARRARAARRRDARGHGQPEALALADSRPAGVCSTPRSRAATTSPRPSRIWCVDSTRTRPPRTTCARRCSSRATADVYRRPGTALPARARRPPHDRRRRRADAALTPSCTRSTTNPTATPRPSLRRRRTAADGDACYAPRTTRIDTLASPRASDPVDYEDGHDPNDGGRPWYRYRVATINDRSTRRSSSRVRVLPPGTACASTSAGPSCARGSDVMAARRARTIAVMCRDGGKTVAEADPEVSEGVDFARFYAASRARRRRFNAAWRGARRAAVELPLRHSRRRRARRARGGQRRRA